MAKFLESLQFVGYGLRSDQSRIDIITLLTNSACAKATRGASVLAYPKQKTCKSLVEHTQRLYKQVFNLSHIPELYFTRAVAPVMENGMTSFQPTFCQLHALSS